MIGPNLFLLNHPSIMCLLQWTTKTHLNTELNRKITKRAHSTGVCDSIASLMENRQPDPTVLEPPETVASDFYVFYSLHGVGGYVIGLNLPARSVGKRIYSRNRGWTAADTHVRSRVSAVGVGVCVFSWSNSQNTAWHLLRVRPTSNSAAVRAMTLREVLFF